MIHVPNPLLQFPAQRLVAELARRFPDGVFYQPTTERVVALTIDDLPNPNDPTDQGLQDILTAIATVNQGLPENCDRIRATFFLISGHFHPQSTVLPQIVAQGHEVGNHGVADVTHAQLSQYYFEQQLRNAHQQILAATQADCIRWYRPGRGLYNRNMRQVLERFALEADYMPKFALASMIPLDTYEWSDHPQFTLWYLRQFIFPGSILVLHGGNSRRVRNAAAVLPLLLAELVEQGYRVVTLSELWAEKYPEG